MNKIIREDEFLSELHALCIRLGYSERQASIRCNKLSKGNDVFVDWSNGSYEMLDGNVYIAEGTVCIEKDGDDYHQFDNSSLCKLNDNDEFEYFDTMETPNIFDWSESIIDAIY